MGARVAAGVGVLSLNRVLVIDDSTRSPSISCQYLGELGGRSSRPSATAIPRRAMAGSPTTGDLTRPGASRGHRGLDRGPARVGPDLHAGCVLGHQVIVLPLTAGRSISLPAALHGKTSRVVVRPRCSGWRIPDFTATRSTRSPRVPARGLEPSHGADGVIQGCGARGCRSPGSSPTPRACSPQRAMKLLGDFLDA